MEAILVAVAEPMETTWEALESEAASSCEVIATGIVDWVVDPLSVEPFQGFRSPSSNANSHLWRNRVSDGFVQMVQTCANLPAASSGSTNVSFINALMFSPTLPF